MSTSQADLRVLHARMLREHLHRRRSFRGLLKRARTLLKAENARTIERAFTNETGKAYYAIHRLRALQEKCATCQGLRGVEDGDVRGIIPCPDCSKPRGEK